MGAMVHSALDQIEYGDAPAVLVYADGRRALERARGLAERVGCRVAAAWLIRRSVPRFDRIAASPPIIVELAGPSEAPATAAFLDRLRAEAERRGRRPSPHLEQQTFRRGSTRLRATGTFEPTEPPSKLIQSRNTGFDAAEPCP